MRNVPKLCEMLTQREAGWKACENSPYHLRNTFVNPKWFIYIYKGHHVTTTCESLHASPHSWSKSWAFIVASKTTVIWAPGQSMPSVSLLLPDAPLRLEPGPWRLCPLCWPHISMSPRSPVTLLRTSTLNVAFADMLTPAFSPAPAFSLSRALSICLQGFFSPPTPLICLLEY